ncbi:hypothetical protein [Exiguobacterium flavidum]|uniref:hypothetical protein n=1 Tax=Exiguobacterium flavidum TaxID=2184695 RepID=UPI000DF77913|nr:hypothetical protein [Exiguobacterium flavidum]
MKKWTKLVIATTLIAPMVTPVLEVCTFAAKNGFRFEFAKGLSFGNYTVKSSDVTGKVSKSDTFVLKANHPLKK